MNELGTMAARPLFDGMVSALSHSDKPTLSGPVTRLGAGIGIFYYKKKKNIIMRLTTIII
jgi:hypothetical protein